MNQNAKKIIGIGGLIVFFILILIYALFVSKNLLFGIKIKNVDFNNLPAQQYKTYTDNVIKITGNAKNAVIITLDGREISIDQQGNFNETIALLPGYNIININAQDKFGYTDEKIFQVIGKSSK